MGKIIACVNEKGGVAKTTTIKNLSVSLASAGKKVLAVDFDPSTNLTISLGVLPDPERKTILDVMKLSEECEDIPEGLAIMHQDEGIDLIPGSKEMHGYESELLGAMQKETVLRRAILSLRDQYDYIFIDCPAGLGVFVVNALFAVDSIIIPVQPQFLGAGAMMNLFEYVNRVRKQNGTRVKPEILGILFTMVRINTNNDMSMMNHYREQYQGKINVFESYIPHSVRFSESDGEGESIFKYAPKSASAVASQAFTDEFLKLEEA